MAVGVTCHRTHGTVFPGLSQRGNSAAQDAPSGTQGVGHVSSALRPFSCALLALLQRTAASVQSDRDIGHGVVLSIAMHWHESSVVNPVKPVCVCNRCHPVAVRHANTVAPGSEILYEM